MPSQLRSDTARANGAKSRGPKSAETKEKSARNSLRHGFTARNIILLECESADEYQKMEEDFAATHQPATPAEQDLVNEMVAARWRINRIRTIETVIMDCEMVRKKAEVEKTFVQPDSGIHMGMAFRTLAEESDRSLCVTAMNPVSRACTSAPTVPSASCSRKPPNPRSRKPNPSHPNHLNQTGASR